MAKVLNQVKGAQDRWVQMFFCLHDSWVKANEILFALGGAIQEEHERGEEENQQGKARNASVKSNDACHLSEALFISFAHSSSRKPFSGLHLYLAYFPLQLHCDNLRSHLLTWIICRQEQNLAEDQHLPSPSLCPPIPSPSSFKPVLNPVVLTVLRLKVRRRDREREEETSEEWGKIDRHWPFPGSLFRRLRGWFPPCVWGKPSIITPLKSNCDVSAALERRWEAQRRGRRCTGQSCLPFTASCHIIRWGKCAYRHYWVWAVVTSDTLKVPLYISRPLGKISEILYGKSERRWNDIN